MSFFKVPDYLEISSISDVPAGTGLTKIDWDKQAREQDKIRLEEIKKQELEAAPKAPEQTT